MKVFVFISLITPIFFGCTVPVNYYIRNLTDEPVKISLIKDGSYDIDKFEFKYINRELPIKFDTYENLIETLKQEPKNNQVNLTILPHSTYHLGFGSNFKQIFNKAIIYRRAGPKDIQLTGTEDLQVHKSFISKYAVWFDIK
ncbi:MAG: hypothetical protein ABJF04_15125 [Reichenbachiella sp.]|uniref:hypothetical protein n=1 Tax=Reichenbachiella sp. TaxID=2184521 RepID=UPI003266E650